MKYHEIKATNLNVYEGLKNEKDYCNYDVGPGPSDLFVGLFKV